MATRHDLICWFVQFPINDKLTLGGKITAVFTMVRLAQTVESRVLLNLILLGDCSRSVCTHHRDLC